MEAKHTDCNWCGKSVNGFLARYHIGKFYHHSCWQQRRADDIRYNIEFPVKR